MNTNAFGILLVCATLLSLTGCSQQETVQVFEQDEPTVEYAAPGKVQLAYGLLLGSVTTHGASFWVRTLDEVPVQAVVSSSEDWSNPIRSKVRQTKSDADYTLILEGQGLQPATLYHYDLLIGGRPGLAPERATFRTYPTAASKVRFQAAFGGDGEVT